MFRLLFITFILLLPIQTIASTTYIVRIAVYNNVESLQNELKKLSPALRKTVQIKKRGAQHIASSVHADKKESLQKLLPSYQKVFPDAFITTEETPDIDTPKTDRVKTEETNKTMPQKKEEIKHTSDTKNTPPQVTQKVLQNPQSRKVVNPTKKGLSLYERLHQKTLYLCAYGPEEWSPNVLIHIAFFDNKVVYTPIQGDVSSKREKYRVDKEKLYISYQGVFDPEIYSAIEDITEDYYLISTWEGERKMTSIRYYFDLEKAEAYVKTLK